MPKLMTNRPSCVSTSLKSTWRFPGPPVANGVAVEANIVPFDPDEQRHLTFHIPILVLTEGRAGTPLLTDYAALQTGKGVARLATSSEESTVRLK